MAKSEPDSLIKRITEFITFVNLPIRQKFTLFTVGSLFWLVVLFAVSVSSLAFIRAKSNTIVHEIIPRDKTVQKIMRNVQSVALDASSIARMRNTAAVIRLSDTARARVDDSKVFLAVLKSGGHIQDYDRETSGLKETYIVAPMNGDADGELYLKTVGPLIDDAGKKLDDIAAARIAAIDGAGGREGVEAGLRELNAVVAQAFKHSSAYSLALSRAGQANSRSIGNDYLYTFIAVVVVLVVATMLFGLFTFWLSNCFTRPITSIISQIRSLGEGDISSLKKIDITSKDEIGILTREFNGLMDSISGLNAFKKLIEEDDDIEDVYIRLANKFRNDFDFQEITIYEIANSQNKMRTVYPLELPADNMACNPDILNDCHLCRAKKTGHEVSSLVQPDICRSFLAGTGRNYICIPLITGGLTGAVFQFLVDPGHGADGKTIAHKLFKARQYMAESASVIDAKRLMATLRDSALKDSLTGLYNRRFLQEYTENLVAGVLRREKHVGLIMCDLDYFKQVNDVYGHNTGDAVLKETAHIIKNSIRASDLVIRFGGEEFLAVLLDIKPGESEAVAEKIRANIEAARMKAPDGIIKKTISLGISEFPTDTDSFWQAIKYADVALYKAKDSGRNTALRFQQEMWPEEQF